MKTPQSAMSSYIHRACFAFAVLVAAHISATAARVCVIPFASVSIGDNDVLVIADALRKGLGSSGVDVVDGFGIFDAMKEDGCGEGGERNRESCILKTGQRYEADIVCAGSLNSVGTLIDLNVALYDVKARAAVWTSRYQAAGGIENFYLNALPKAIGDMNAHIRQSASEPTAEAAAPAEKDTLVSEPAAQPDKAKPQTEKSVSPEQKEFDNGIVAGPTIGLCGRIAA